MRNGNLFWGVVLILLGGLILFDAIEYFWPALLIILGGAIIAGAYLRSSTKNEAVSVDLQSAKEVTLKVNHGAGRLSLTDGASAGKALEGDGTEGIKVDAHHAGDRLDIRVGTDAMFIPFLGINRGLEWNLRLPNDIPFALDLETGASQSVVDLSRIRVTRLKVQIGASSTEITMPASGIVTADAQAGAAELKMRIPHGVAARIRSDSGLAEIKINTTRFPYANGIYESPDFGNNPNRIDLTIEAGVGKVSVL